MEFKYLNFTGLICFIHIALANGGPAWIPLCQNPVLNNSNHSMLFNNGTSSGSQGTSNSTFCFCTVQSNHSFTLEIKRIKIRTHPLGNGTQLDMFFTNGEHGNNSCEKINLVDVYNKPFDTDCLAAFSPDQNSSEYCWSKIRNFSAFGFYKNMSSYMRIYLTLKGDGIINTNCSNSSVPPTIFSLDQGCGEDNSSFTTVKNAQNNDTSTVTNVQNNDTSTITNAQNSDTSTPGTTSVQTTSQKNGTNLEQTEENDFNIMNIGILLISVGAGFLLLSIFLLAITCRKRKKEDTSTDDDDVEKTLSPVSLTTENDKKIPCKDNSEYDKSPSLARNVSSLHDGAASKTPDDPVSRRHTDGHIDLELKELGRKPHYVAMKDLNRVDDGARQLLGDKDTGSQGQVETGADKNQQTCSTTYKNEQNQEPTGKNQPLPKSNEIKESLCIVNPGSGSADQPLQASVESQSPKQNHDTMVSKVCPNTNLETVDELDVQPSNGITDSEVLDDDNGDSVDAIYVNYSNDSIHSKTIPTSSLECSNDLDPYVNISGHTNTKTDLNDSSPQIQAVNQTDPTEIHQVSSIKRSPDELPKEKAPVEASSKHAASEPNSLPDGQDKTANQTQVKTLNGMKNTESKTPTLNSQHPPVPTNKEEPDYDTISTSSEGTDEVECKKELQAATGKSNDKPPESKSRAREESPSLTRKESVKVIFLKPQTVTPSDEESLCPWLDAEEKTPKPVRLQQARSFDVDLLQNTRVKPDTPIRSVSEDTILKTSDADFENEGEHLYEEVDDDLKALTTSNNESQIKHDEMNVTPSDQSPALKNSREMLEANKDIPFTDGQHNLDHMVDNDIYTLPDDAFESLALNGKQGQNNKTNPYTNKTGLDQQNESDRHSMTKM